jgi:hypothetical protein
MEDIMANGHGGLYLAALTNEQSFDEYTAEILKLGYNATLDSPPAVFALKWANKFPNARVLHNQRDTPEAWEKSLRQLLHAFRFINAFPLNTMASMKFIEWG